MALRGERYETLRVIASGGMATVHLGRALGAGGFERLVAIKIMHPHLASEPSFVAMFLDEARLAARIRHPNVVSTLDVQADDDGVFLVMEYVEGPSLQQVFRALLKKNGRLPLEVLIRILTDTLAGLHAAHELRDSTDQPLHLVHRDVSPQNVLIGVDGISRITDFGVASAEARLSSTQGGQVKGKIGYMSPEQARAEALDRRADIYAAGVMLWEVLSGGHRFRTGNEATILTRVAEGDCVRPGLHNPDVPPALEECCMRALMRDPADRYSTAADFAEALEAAAIASSIQLVTARGLAAFVTELGAHARPIDLPAPLSVRASLAAPLSLRDARLSLSQEGRPSPEGGPARDGHPSSSHDTRPSSPRDAGASPSDGSLPALGEARPPRQGDAGRSLPGESPSPGQGDDAGSRRSRAGGDEASQVETRPERRMVPADVSPTSMSTANLIRQASMTPPAGSSKRLYLGVAVALFVALVVVTAAMRSRTGGPPDDSRPTSANGPGTGAAVPTASPSVLFTTASPPVAAPAPTASVGPSAAAAAGSGSAAPTATAAEPKGSTRKPDAKRPPGGDTRSPVYRPPDL